MQISLLAYMMYQPRLRQEIEVMNWFDSSSLSKISSRSSGEKVLFHPLLQRIIPPQGIGCSEEEEYEQQQ